VPYVLLFTVFHTNHFLLDAAHKEPFSSAPSPITYPFITAGIVLPWQFVTEQHVPWIFYLVSGSREKLQLMSLIYWNLIWQKKHTWKTEH